MNTIAVYGTLKKGHGNHRLIAGQYEGEPIKAVLRGFEMRDVGAFPFIRREPKGIVHVEVYRLPSDRAEGLIRRMDMLEGYSPNRSNVFYVREQVEVELVESGERMQVWVYTGDKTEHQVSEFFDTYNNYALVEDGIW